MKGNKFERLTRLQKLKVEQQRLALQPLKKRIEALEHEIAMIEQNIRDEQKISLASIEGAMAYAHYIQGIFKRLDQIKKFLREAQLKLIQELEVLKEMAGTQKVYGNAQERFRNEQVKNDEKNYQHFMDEKASLIQVKQNSPLNKEGISKGQ